MKWANIQLSTVNISSSCTVVLAADSPLKPERSLLQKEVREESPSHDLSQDTPKEKTLSPPYKAGIGAAGVIVMCCTFLCPCLYKKKKATTHTVLEKDPKSSESKMIQSTSQIFEVHGYY